MLKTVKVSIDKLDLLLNNVGELVIANSGFYKLYEEMRKISEEKSIINEFKSRMEQMSRIAKDLQSGIMKTRMVPIGQVFTPVQTAGARPCQGIQQGRGAHHQGRGDRA